MIAADPMTAELPLEAPRDEQVELRAAWASVRRKHGRSFEAAMRDPLLATCIRNLAHARRRRETAR